LVGRATIAPSSHSPEFSAQVARKRYTQPSQRDVQLAVAVSLDALAGSLTLDGLPALFLVLQDLVDHVL